MVATFASPQVGRDFRVGLHGVRDLGAPLMVLDRHARAVEADGRVRLHERDRPASDNNQGGKLAFRPTTTLGYSLPVGGSRTHVRRCSGAAPGCGRVRR